MIIKPIPALTNPPYIPIIKKTKHDTIKLFPFILSYKSPFKICGLNSIIRITIIIIIERILLKFLSSISMAICAPIRDPIKAKRPI